MANTCEMVLRKAARALERADLARIWKWPEEKITKKVGVACGNCGAWREELHVVHSARPGSDFFGYTRTGRAVLIESKQSKAPRLPLGEKGLKPHQYFALLDCHKAGGIALVCWLHGDTMAILDMDMVKELSGDRKSVPWKGIPERFLRLIGEETDFLQLLDPFIRPESVST